jgi:hypothetical protein
VDNQGPATAAAVSGARSGAGATSPTWSDHTSTVAGADSNVTVTSVPPSTSRHGAGVDVPVSGSHCSASVTVPASHTVAADRWRAGSKS